jgi:hypothetical protein
MFRDVIMRRILIKMFKKQKRKCPTYLRISSPGVYSYVGSRYGTSTLGGRNGA